MKAVLLGRCPGVTLIDVSHEVPPFDVLQGAFVLWAGTRHFEPGTVHLAVVDPGVGTSRRPIALSLGGSWYVGPDNGLLGLVLEETHASPDVGVELTRAAGASPTFEGRDVFAPAAAALARGSSPESLGRTLASPPLGLAVQGPVVLWVDRFGNLVTSLKPPLAGVRIAGRAITSFARTFGEAPSGQPFLYVGSMGFVEVAVRTGRADMLLGAVPGTPVEALR
jgi:S-adenosylmethionine hydrolase